MLKFKYTDNISRRYCLLFLLCIYSLIVASQEKVGSETVIIPEPLNFDLVRGLGAKQGELEINALADFPINRVSSRNVEWAPEIEYAVFNNLAIELEFPFNNFELEAFKMAVQWTIGQSKSNKFIHGIQIISEVMLLESITEFSALYVPGYRFNDVWSALGLFGVMLEAGSDAPDKKHTILINASVFADLSEHTVIGLELNNSDPSVQKKDDNEMELLVLPQVHYEFESGLSFQFGFGPKFTQKQTNVSAVLRVIKSF